MNEWTWISLIHTSSDLKTESRCYDPCDARNTRMGEDENGAQGGWIKNLGNRSVSIHLEKPMVTQFVLNENKK